MILFHKMWSADNSAQDRSVVALDNFRRHLCKITGPNYPIGSGASKTRSSRNFSPAGSNDLNRISCISDFFRFRYKFRHDNRCTFSLRSNSDESNLRIKAFLPFFAAQNLFVSTNFLKAIIEGAAATLSL